jgi:LacI family xylobiose transport system transcriptional regulator
LVHASFAETGMLDGLLSKVSVDGAIVIPQRLNQSEIKQLQDPPIRSVLADYRAPSVPSVYVDNVRLGYTMARHLLDLGHRRIGVLAGHEAWFNAVERLRGVNAALEEFGVELPPHYLATCDFNYAYQETLAKTPRMFTAPGDHGPTAILAANDTIAAGIYRVAEQLHLRIPHDLSVVGCDDATFASYLSPPLTTIDQDPRQMGGSAVELLLGQSSESCEVAFRLILRGSTAPPSR